MSNSQCRSYCDLDVWQLSMEIAKLIYEATKRFPAEERFGINQMRRAAVSIPSNIAGSHVRLDTLRKMLRGLHRSLEKRAHE